MPSTKNFQNLKLLTRSYFDITPTPLNFSFLAPTHSKFHFSLNLSNQLPSLAQVFECTRARDGKKKYADTYEDTAKKIEAMKCFQPKEDGSGPKDAFLSVMNKEYPGRRRLYGRGITTKVLNKASAAAVPYVVPDEIVDKLREDMEAQNTKVADIRKELEADYEQKKADLEADYAKKMEEFEKSKEGLVEDVL